MNLFEYNSGGKVIGFRLSNAAQVEIERIQSENLKSINPDIFKYAIKMKDVGDIEDDDTDSLESLLELMPYLEEIEKIEKSITPCELMYILLHNNPQYRDLTKEEWNDLVWEMEDNLGYEVVCEKFAEVYDKVFSLLGMMNPQKKSKPKSRKTSKKNMEA